MKELVVTETTRPQTQGYFAPSDHGFPNGGFLNWDTLLWRFAAERSYWVNSYDVASGKPHTMPVWGIWQDAAFRFSTAPHSRKAQNLKAHAFCNVHLANTEAVLVMECQACEVVIESEQQAFVDEYNPKYKWDFKPADVAGGLFALTPQTAFAWSAGEGEGFSHTATRWKFNVMDN